MRIAIIFISVICLELVNAQDTLSLEGAIQLGLQNNYQIQIANKQLEIDRNNNSWGAAGLYPSVSFSTTMSGVADRYVDPSLLAMAQQSLNDSTLNVNTQQALTVTPSVNLNWTIFNGFSAKISKSRLAYYEQQSEGNTVIVVENTLQSILLSYHFALVQKESLDVLREVKDLSKDRYRYVLTKKEFGNAVTFDVLQAQNSYLADSANELRQEINYRNALRNLNLVLAEPVEKDYILKEGVSEVDQDFLLSDLVTKLESNNKTLQNQYFNQEILRKNVQQSKSNLYPMLSLSAGFGRTYSGLYGELENYLWDNNGYRATGSLTLSYALSNGGNVRRAIQNARIREEMGELQLEQMKQSLYNQLFTILEQYEIKRQLLHVAEVRIESARLNLQIGDEKFKSGAINSFNYRDIQLVFLNSALESLQARYNLIDSYTELLRLTGGIVTEFE